MPPLLPSASTKSGTATLSRSLSSFFLGKNTWANKCDDVDDGDPFSWLPTTALRSSGWWWWWWWWRTSPRVRFWCRTVPFLLRDLLLFLLSIAAMAPGCLRMGWFYWIASHRLTFAYGPESVRQRLDVYPAVQKKNRNGSDYSSNNSNENKAQAQAPPPPTLLFFYGGAWLIGYKLFGCLLARTLTAAGITVVVADYRNYPVAAVPEQVDDAEAALRWTLRNIDRYGGDASNVVVGGESAGGHLVLLVLLQRVLGLRRNGSRNSDGSEVNSAAAAPPSSGWNPTDLKGVIAVAAPIHLASLEQVLARHRWERHFLECIFGGPVEEHCPHSLLLRAHASGSSDSHKATTSSARNSESNSSTTRRRNNPHGVAAAGSANRSRTTAYHHHHEPNGTSTTTDIINNNNNALLLRDKLPPIRLYHGTHDQTVPLQGVETFFHTLRQLGADATLTVYPGWTHIHANVQGPMAGDYAFHRDVFEAVRQWTTTAPQSTTQSTEPSTTTTTTQSTEPSTTTLATDEQQPSSSSASHLEFPSHDLDLMQSFCPHILIQLGTLLMPF